MFEILKIMSDKKYHTTDELKDRINKSKISIYKQLLKLRRKGLVKEYVEKQVINGRFKRILYMKLKDIKIRDGDKLFDIGELFKKGIKGRVYL